jgi:hypothetical protein
VNLLDALTDDSLLARAFAGESWAPWRTFVKVIDAQPLTPDEQALFERCTGRTVPPTQRVTEIVAIVGRRGGKSRLSAALAIEAACLTYWAPHLAVGEVPVVAIIAADRSQATVVMNYTRGLLQSAPLLDRMIVRETDTAIELVNGVRIEVTTCSARTSRGYSFATVICDELAFWRSETSSEPDTEVLGAVKPGLSTLRGSRLVCISSPYAKSGALWTAFKDHFGKDGDPTLVWVAPSLTMNPSLDPAVVTAAYERDPESASAEYGAEFRRDVAAFVDRATVEAAVLAGVQGIPPDPGRRYFAFTDPAGGSGADSMTLAIAHREPDGTVVLDCLTERTPPFSPENVTAEFARVLRAYGCASVHGDRYAGGWPSERFSAHGIAYEPSAKTKSEVYVEFLVLLNSGRAKLLDLARLVAQFCSLERRATRGGGKDIVDHGAHGHDDSANAAAGALTLAATRGTDDGLVLAANLAPERRRRVLDEREFELLRRGLY